MSFPGFSFGTSAPAPTTPGGFGAAPAPTTTTATATTVAFGTPAPSTSGGFGFGSAPASGGGGGGLFGKAPAAPTSGGGLFGTGFGTTPAAPSASTGGFGFGATPAPFGAPQQQQQQQQAIFQLSPKTLYKDLPPQYQQEIDKILHAIMEHRRTMARVQSMGPAPLIIARDKKIPIQKELQAAKVEMETNLMPQLSMLSEHITALQDAVRQVMFNAVTHAMWPIEMVANTRGIRISKNARGAEEKKEERVDAELYAMLDRQVAHVNRLERLPSPFLWQALQDFQTRLAALQASQDNIKARAQQQDWDGLPVTYLITQQDEKLFFLRRHLKTLSVQMDHVRAHYARMETAVPNVLQAADMKQAEREQRVKEEYQRHAFLAQATGGGSTSNTTGGALQPPTALGAPAPPSSLGFSFGPTPAPAPTSAFGFGSGPTLAPAPTTSGGAVSFGSTISTTSTTPAPAFGAPTTTPAFGSTTSSSSSTMAVPAFGAAAPTPGPFGSTTTATPQNKKKPGGRSRSRR